MTDSKIVQMDERALHARAVTKNLQADLRYVKVASLKMMTRLESVEAKRLFTRCFGSMQRNAYFISVTARSRLRLADVALVEAALREDLVSAAKALNSAINEAEELFKMNGIIRIASYPNVPLAVEVEIVLSNGRRYFEVLHKLDQLIPMLQTLVVHEVLSLQEATLRRAKYVRLTRNIAQQARKLANGLRTRLNALNEVDLNAARSGVTLSRSELAQVDDTIKSISGTQMELELHAPTPAQDDVGAFVVDEQATPRERPD